MVSQAHLMNNRVGKVVDEVDGLGHVHRRLQLVLLRQLQQLPGERKRWGGKKIMAGPYFSRNEEKMRREKNKKTGPYLCWSEEKMRKKKRKWQDLI